MLDFNLSAWIQNPNTEESDLILKNGKFISVESESLRKEISKMMFHIDEKGKEFYASNDLKIIKDKDNKGIYLIKLQTLKLDENGRTMPMMILVENYRENTRSDLQDMIDETLKTSDYEVNKEHIEKILNQLKSDLENNLKKKNIFTIGVGIVLLVALIFLIIMILK